MEIDTVYYIYQIEEVYVLVKSKDTYQNWISPESMWQHGYATKCFLYLIKMKVVGIGMNSPVALCYFWNHRVPFLVELIVVTVAVLLTVLVITNPPEEACHIYRYTVLMGDMFCL